LGKYAAAFLMSRSIWTKAGSRFTRASFASTSVSGRWLLPIPSSFPAIKARSQFSRVYVFC
jgi:hypothetical protein